MVNDSRRLSDRIFCVLIALMMTVSLVFTNAVTGSAEETSSANADIGQLQVTNYRLWLNNELLKDGVTVKDGDLISLAIDWRIKNNENKLDYAAEIDTKGFVLKSGATGSLYTDGDEIGTYSVENSTFRIKLDEEAVKNKSDLGGGALLDGVVSLDADDTLSDGSKQYLGAGDKTFEVIYDSGSGAGNVTVKKSSVGSITYEDGKYYQSYSISLTTQGKISDVVLTDALPDTLTLDSSSVEVSPADNVKVDADSFTLTFPGNATKQATTSYTVTYHAEISRDAVLKGSAIKNTATVNYVDALGNPQVKTASKSVTPKKPSLSKVGYASVNTDTENMSQGIVLTYTIKFDPGTIGAELTEDDLKELTLDDTLTALTSSSTAANYNAFIPYYDSETSSYDANAAMLMTGSGYKKDGGTTQMQVTLDKFEKNSDGTYTFTYKLAEHIYNLMSSTEVENTADLVFEDIPLTSTSDVDLVQDIVPKDIMVKSVGDVEYTLPDGTTTTYSGTTGSNNTTLTDYNEDSMTWKIEVDLSKIPETLRSGPLPNTTYWTGLKISDELVNPSGFSNENQKYNCTCENGHTYSSGSVIGCDKCEYCSKYTFKITVYDSKGSKVQYGVSDVINVNQLYMSSYSSTALTINEDSWTFDFSKIIDYGYFSSFIANGYKIVIEYQTPLVNIQQNGANTLVNSATSEITFLGKTVTESGIISANNPNPDDNYATINVSPSSNPDEVVPFSNISKYALSKANIEGENYVYTDGNYLGWAIDVPLSSLNLGDTLTITDTLGDNLNFVDDSVIVYKARTGSTTSLAKNAIYNDAVSVTNNGDGTITFDFGEISSELIAGRSYYHLVIYYQTMVDYESWYSQYPGVSRAYLNSATAICNNTTYPKITASQTLKAPSVITKTGTPHVDYKYNSIYADYTIDVNKNSTDLGFGGDTLSVTDTMASTFVLDTDSIAVYDASSGENAVLDESKWTYEYDTENNVIVFTVPNEMHVVIEYSVDIDVDPIDDILWYMNTTNTAQIYGFALNQKESSVNFASFEANIRVWAYDLNGDVTIYKYYNADGEFTALPGAEFAIYSVYDNNGKWYSEEDDVDSDGNEKSLKEYCIRSGIVTAGTDSDSVKDSDNTADTADTDETVAEGTVTVTDLPLDRIYKLVETKAPEGFAGGEEYYFVLEGHDGITLPDGYISEETADEMAEAGEDTDGLKIVHTFKSGGTIEYENRQLISITGTKTWANDKSENRPDSITLDIYRKISGGKESKIDVPTENITWENTATDTWKYTVSGLYKYDEDGNEYIYRIEEESVVGYDTAYDETNPNNITNTLQTVDVSGTKTWANEGKYTSTARPDSIKLTLYADDVKVSDSEYTVTWKNNDKSHDEWAFTIENLPKVNSDGKDIVYTVSETAVNGYTTTYSDDTLKITNTYQQTSVSGTKTWANEGKYTESARPDSIKLTLYADGEVVPDTDYTVTWTDNDKEHTVWNYTIENLPKINASGKDIVYTVEETAVNGYATTYSEDTLNITNTYQTVAVSGTKTWANEGKYISTARPDSIKLTLYADGKEVSDSEYTVKWTDNDKSHDKWAFTIENLPKVNADGKDIVYTVKETAVNGYATTYSKDTLNITNTYQTVAVSGTKTWANEGKYTSTARPESIKLTLYADGEVVPDSEYTVTWTDNDKEHTVWNYTIENLPKVNASGKDIVYTVKETAVNGYTTTYSKDTLNITNTYQTVAVSGTKTWANEGKYTDSARPESIKLTLYADDVKVSDSEYTVKWTDNDNKHDVWKYTIENLPKVNASGKDIVYTVKETAVNGYTTTYSDDTLKITNTYQQTSVSGTKTWANEGKYTESARPESIKLTLYADGEVVSDTDYTVTWKNNDKSHDEWAFTIENLPKVNSDGKDIVYTVSETAVNGYTTTYSDDTLKITNTYQQTSVSGTKTWANEGKYTESARPDSIKLTLYADGEVVSDTDYTVTWTDNDNKHDVWKFTIENLPKINASGKDIVYTVEETAVNGYATTYSEDGLGIVNTYQLTDVSGTKTWTGDNKNVRPESISLTLYADGVETAYDEILWTDTDSDEWHYSIKDMPVYNLNGEKIVYTVVENDVAEGYTAIYSDSKLDIENSYSVPLTEINGTKEWVGDSEVKADTRPDSVEITLLANGEPADFEYSVVWTNTDSDVWNYTISDIPTRDSDGVIITYTVREENVPLGYTDVVYGFDIRNTFEAEKTDVSGTKTWIYDSSEVRPDEISLTLYADGEPVDGAVAVWTDKDTDKWNYTFEQLDKYRYAKDENGTVTRTEIVYSVSEEVPEKYTAEYAENGLDITNTRITETEISKINADGEGLSGAVLEITDANGNSLDKWTTDGNVHTVYGLTAGGEYTLSEISAPDGYEIAEPIAFTVSTDGTVVSVVMTDELTPEDDNTPSDETPQTPNEEVETPDDNENPPDEDVETPEDNENPPDEDEETPNDDDSTPDDDDSTPDTPKDGEEDDESGNGTHGSVPPEDDDNPPTDSTPDSSTPDNSETTTVSKSGDVTPNTGAAGGSLLAMAVLAAGIIVVSKKKK